MAKTTITLPTEILKFVAHKATQQNITKSGYIESLVKKDMKASINALLE
jgi:mannitol/fructose-specific phosphotransferase system IIA component